MANEGHLILNEKQITQKIRRIAFQIYENNFSEKEIWIAGIFEQGYFFAQLLSKEIEKISTIKVNLISIELDKSNPADSPIKLDTKKTIGQQQCVVLADDVLNTGKTLMYCLNEILSFDVKKIETAVLVNRKHSLFPISATYTGYELSTTINNHVSVVLTTKTKKVLLMDS